MASKTLGYVVHRGAGFDGQPVVIIATRSSKNEKTGTGWQLWTLLEGLEPTQARREGADAGVCGDCPFRDGSCYVLLHQAPLAIYRAYKRGRYTEATDTASNAWHSFINDVAGRYVRFGAYGEPVLLPVEKVATIAAAAGTFTGYSHAWRTVSAEFARYFMASVETEAEALQAVAAGWRYYRVRPVGTDAEIAGEIDCPSARGIACADCGLCSGTGSRAGARSVSIQAHGNGANKASKRIALSEV